MVASLSEGYSGLDTHALSVSVGLEYYPSTTSLTDDEGLRAELGMIALQQGNREAGDDTQKEDHRRLQR
jgi:hypothetical protein